MQIQKQLFRIAERTLKNQQGLIYWKAVFYFLTIASILFTLLFGYAYLVILPSNLELTRCSQKASFKFQQDTINVLTDIGLPAQQIQYYNQNSQTIYDGKSCIIIKNRNSTIFDEYRMKMGGQSQVIFMDQQKQGKLNYTNYTFIFKQFSPLRKFLFNYQNLLINEILENKYQIFPKLPFVKSTTAIIYYHNRDIELSISNKIILLFYAVFSYIIISIVTSLYLYGTIVSAPAVILMFLKCCNYLQNQNFNQVYKIFPWIGLHSIVRETSQNPNIKHSSMQICKAILFYFLFLYLVYYASIVWVDKTLFYFHTEAGIQQLLFGYTALVEFAAIIFMRTRTFIKYFPSFHSILIIITLYYGEISIFGFKKLACYATFSISCALFIWMIIHVEIPAQTTWDRNDLFTPTVDRPRVGYFSIFNMSWINNLPEQWTMMIPLFGRQHFLPRQMALVDRNFQQLGEALQN